MGCFACGASTRRKLRHDARSCKRSHCPGGLSRFLDRPLPPPAYLAQPCRRSAGRLVVGRSLAKFESACTCSRDPLPSSSPACCSGTWRRGAPALAVTRSLEQHAYTASSKFCLHVVPWRASTSLRQPSIAATAAEPISVGTRRSSKTLLASARQPNTLPACSAVLRRMAWPSLPHGPALEDAAWPRPRCRLLHRPSHRAESASIPRPVKTVTMLNFHMLGAP